MNFTNRNIEPKHSKLYLLGMPKYYMVKRWNLKKSV